MYKSVNICKKLSSSAKLAVWDELWVYAIPNPEV